MHGSTGETQTIYKTFVRNCLQSKAEMRWSCAQHLQQSHRQIDIKVYRLSCDEEHDHLKKCDFGK